MAGDAALKECDRMPDYCTECAGPVKRRGPFDGRCSGCGMRYQHNKAGRARRFMVLRYRRAFSGRAHE